MSCQELYGPDAALDRAGGRVDRSRVLGCQVIGGRAVWHFDGERVAL